MNKTKPGLRKKLALELFRPLVNDAVRKHELNTLFWECTLRCNLSCRHCGSDCKADVAGKDMPAADFLRVIDSITPHVNPNKVMIALVGGEALVRRDIETVGRALYDRGYPWGMVTNGMLLDRRRFDSLLGAGLHSITVSLDGFADDHNWMRGHPQSFARAAATIPMMAAEKELAWDIVTCANRRNFDALPQFREFLISEGVAEWRIFTVFPAGRALHDPDMHITDEQFVQLMDFISQTRREGRIKVSYGCEGFLGGYEADVRDNFYHCSAGVSTASVLADGSISGCLSIRADYHQGNIYTDDFMEVWNNRFDRYRNREWMRVGQCGKCRMFRYCKGGGMHLRDGNGNLTLCHLHRIDRGTKNI